MSEFQRFSTDFPHADPPSIEGLLSDLVAYSFDGLAELRVHVHRIFDLANRVDYRRVISVSEQPTDMHERKVQQISNQVHGDLARDRQVLGPPL
jgi:hypothetical protein